MGNKIKRILKPGQPGTRKLLEQYGDNLVCVRYRYDEERRKRVKTAELIVEEVPWNPPARKPPMNKTMYIKIEYGEIYLGRLVKANGGRWNRQKKVWELPYKTVLELKLEDRIVRE